MTRRPWAIGESPLDDPLYGIGLTYATQLYPVPERVDVHGKVRLALDENAVTQRVAALKDHGIEAVAICFMHSYANAAHEQRTAEILKNAMPLKPFCDSSALRLRTAADPQKKAAFHLSRPRWMMP